MLNWIKATAIIILPIVALVSFITFTVMYEYGVFVFLGLMGIILFGVLVGSILEVKDFLDERGV